MCQTNYNDCITYKLWKIMCICKRKYMAWFRGKIQLWSFKAIYFKLFMNCVNGLIIISSSNMECCNGSFLLYIVKKAIWASKTVRMRKKCIVVVRPLKLSFCLIMAGNGVFCFCSKSLSTQKGNCSFYVSILFDSCIDSLLLR